MTPAEGHREGLIFQQPVHGNMKNVLRSVHKEFLIFTAHSDLCMYAFEILSNSLLIVPDQRCAYEKQRRDAFELTVWIYCCFSSSAMTSFAPPECMMNGTTESHNDHILNRRWHRKGLAFSAVCYVSPGLHTGWVVGEEM